MNEQLLKEQNIQRAQTHFTSILPESFTSLVKNPVEYFIISPWLIQQRTVIQAKVGSTIEINQLKKKNYNSIVSTEEITIAHIEENNDTKTLWGTIWTHPSRENPKRILERIVELRVNTSVIKNLWHVSYYPSLLFLQPTNLYEDDLVHITLPGDKPYIDWRNGSIFSDEMINYIHVFMQRVDDGFSFANLQMHSDYFPQFITDDIINKFKEKKQFSKKEIVFTVFTSVFCGLISHYPFLLENTMDLQDRIFYYLDMFFLYSHVKKDNSFEQVEQEYHFIESKKIAENLAYYCIKYITILSEAELEELLLLAKYGHIPPLLNTIFNNVYSETSLNGKKSHDRWVEFKRRSALEGDFIPF
jgi:hypothetical protein